MTHQQLKARLYSIAVDGLRTANQNNPFYSKREAMRSINNAARIAASN
jgi:hypothetical protein